jgi:hypothetical protein
MSSVTKAFVSPLHRTLFTSGQPQLLPDVLVNGEWAAAGVDKHVDSHPVNLGIGNLTGFRFEQIETIDQVNICIDEAHAVCSKDRESDFTKGSVLVASTRANTIQTEGCGTRSANLQ